jgi:hypothetical protein
MLRHRGVRAGERGQVIPLVALFMALVIVPIWVVFTDSTAAEEAQHRAAAAAFMAADSASQVVEFDGTGPFTGSEQARLGQQALAECASTGQADDPGATVSCCLTDVQGATPSPTQNCSQAARYLHVVVARDVQLPVAILGWPVIHVSASADGRAAVGTVTSH